MGEMDGRTGKVVRIAGPVVVALGLRDVCLFDVVHVGEMGLIGEVIRLSGDQTTIQVYEDTSGLQVGEKVVNSRAPLMAQLGPGLLGSVYDGLQRPLTGAADESGIFLERGLALDPLPAERYWQFTPHVEIGWRVSEGDVLGVVQESKTILHRILVPEGASGRVVSIQEGQYRNDDVVATIRIADDENTCPISLRQTWAVRRPRPYLRKRQPRTPLITGMRIIDAFFPVAKGGSAIIPGGFGTGKTVAEHSLASWADADVVVYVGCGERGNEMAEVLAEFPQLEDPLTGAPLMERTILIANTSNMPVAAREASIYLGITLAEYYRDMGYDVLMLADSTSRWGEALREISGRLEEMPGEEGYPAYLSARLSEFYERSGRTVCLGIDKISRNGDGPVEKQHMGSVTLVGAVSPPGGDFSEPMTQNSLRVVGTFWGLDYDLSRRRHFPAINWSNSYTLYDLDEWYRGEVAPDWEAQIREAKALLQEEVELMEIVQLVGPDSLADEQREVLAVTRMLREDFLQQSAYDEVDRFCSLLKAYWMLRVILAFHHQASAALKKGFALEKLTSLPVMGEIARMKEIPVEGAPAALEQMISKIDLSFRELK